MTWTKAMNLLPEPFTDRTVLAACAAPRSRRQTPCGVFGDDPSRSVFFFTMVGEQAAWLTRSEAANLCFLSWMMNATFAPAC